MDAWKKNRLMIDGLWSSEISLDLISASPRSSLPSTTISICCSDRSIARWKDLKIDGTHWTPGFVAQMDAQVDHVPQEMEEDEESLRDLWGGSNLCITPIGDWITTLRRKESWWMIHVVSCGFIDNLGSTVYLLRMGWWSQLTCMFFACVETTNQQCKGPERDCWVTCSDKC